VQAPARADVVADLLDPVRVVDAISASRARAHGDAAAEPVEVLGRIGYLSEQPDLPGWMRVDELLRYTKAFFPKWDSGYAQELLAQPGPDRVFALPWAMQNGHSIKQLHELTHIDEWFLHCIHHLVEIEDLLRIYKGGPCPKKLLFEAKRAGFSDRDIWDISAIAGFFNMSNRVASATDMQPNDAYHGQAR
jgi:hypothetical protein